MVTARHAVLMVSSRPSALVHAHGEGEVPRAQLCLVCSPVKAASRWWALRDVVDDEG